MGIVFRQSVKSTIVIFAGNLLGGLFTYLGTYVFKDDLQGFGFSRTILNIGLILQLIVLMGSAAVIQLYMQRYSRDNAKKRMLITLCSLTPVVAVVLLLPCYLLFKGEIINLFQAKDHRFFNQYYLWIPVLTLLWGYTTLYEYYLFSQHKTAQAVFIREVLLRVGNLIVLAAFYFKLISFSAFIIGSVVMYGLSALVLVLLAMRTEGFGFSWQWNAFSRSEYKEILKFSWYHLLGGISFSLIGFLDTLMLASIDKQGLASIPVYLMAVFIVNVMTIPYRGMTNALVPVLNQAYIDNDQEKLEDAFKRSGINMLIVTIAMLLIISLNLGNAVAMLPKGYEDVLPLSLIMMLGRMADMGTGPNTELINISSYYKFNFRISLVLLILIITLNFALIPKYGAFGAAWSVAISQLVFNISKVIFIRVKMGLYPFSAKSLLVVLIGAVTALVVYFIPFIWHPIADAIIRSAIICAIYAALLIWLRPAPDINTYLASIRKNKRFF